MFVEPTDVRGLEAHERLVSRDDVQESPDGTMEGSGVEGKEPESNGSWWKVTEGLDWAREAEMELGPVIYRGPPY